MNATESKNDPSSFDRDEITHTAGLLEYAGCIGGIPTAIMSESRQVAHALRASNAYGDGISWDEAHHNAHRLTAAWNACDGLSTEDLEALGAGGFMRERLDSAQHASASPWTTDPPDHAIRHTGDST